MKLLTPFSVIKDAISDIKRTKKKTDCKKVVLWYNVFMNNEYNHPDFYKSPNGVVYEKNPKITYPHLYRVFLLDSHNTSWFWIREDGTCYWQHTRKDKDMVTEDADELQMDLFGKPILTKEFIMKAIL